MDSITQHGCLRVGSSEADGAQPYASYGKACSSCVKSKTRCATSTTGGRCERCQRMNRDCKPAPTLRKRGVSKRPTSSKSTKTAALEAKLDGIVQMLQHSQASIPAIGQSGNQIHNRSLDSNAFTDRTLTSSEAGDADEFVHIDANAQGTNANGGFFAANKSSSTTGGSLDEIAQHTGLSTYSKVGEQELFPLQLNIPPTPAASCTNSTAPGKPNDYNDYPLETESELEEYLETYRTKMVSYFPIVCIHPEMTLQDLKKERPFLYLVIRAVCSKHLGRQGALILEVKKVLARDMLLDGAKNLDLLLGALVFAGWCQFYLCYKPIISTVIQLGASLAFDLGLMRPLPTEPASVMLYLSAQGCPKPIHTSYTRTIEERRAAIGLYLVTSVAANYFQRIEHLRWSPYLDECLRILEKEKDYATDELLVYLVRVQLICNNGSGSTWSDVFGDATSRIPAELYVKALKSQLDDLERSSPLGLKSNVTLQLHILNTILSIHEHSLSSSTASTSSDPAAQLQRIESLWICLTSVKSWFTTFLNLEFFPLSSYPHVSMVTLTQMAHCLVALYRLSVFESPNIPWDRQKVRQELDFGDVLKILADRWDQVPRAAGVENGPPRVSERGDDMLAGEVWSSTSKKLLGIGNWWEKKVAAMMLVNGERKSGPEAQNGSMEGFEISEQPQVEVVGFGAMNLDLDDIWVGDLLGAGFDYNLEPYF